MFPVKKKPTLEDRLAAARAARCSKFEIAGTSLELHKWNYDQVLAHTATITKALKVFLTDGEGQTRKGFLKTLMSPKTDVGAILQEWGNEIRFILADTVVQGNFENRDEAMQWVNELSMDETMTLGYEIFKRNCGPLAQRLGIAMVPGLNSGDAKDVNPSTSSPTLSQPGSSTEQSCSNGPEKKSTSTGQHASEENTASSPS